jgi:hypothetical protein
MPFYSRVTKTWGTPRTGQGVATWAWGEVGDDRSQRASPLDCDPAGDGDRATQPRNSSGILVRAYVAHTSHDSPDRSGRGGGLPGVQQLPTVPGRATL